MNVSGDKILVIGGAGYVGSHFARFAVSSGYKVTVMDNLSKGHEAAVSGLDFLRIDLLDFQPLVQYLTGTRYDAIYHFAASSLVGESVTHPAEYYRNNVIAAFNMLEALRMTGHNRLVFSSTCAVYGVPQSLPLTEDHPKNPVTPYGRTKLAIEWMLEDYHHAYGLQSASLRYFNAAGCEPDHGLGEDHRPETHLIPNVVRSALKLQDELVIFGDDYPTRDGTCIRDYVHVTDLAEAHLKVLEKLDEMPLLTLNLGTGSGFSNLEVVEAARRVSGIDMKFSMGPRRPGDPPELVADPKRAFTLLNWTPTRSGLDSMISEVLRWFSEHPRGYAE